MSSIIRRYLDDMNFAAYVVFPFIIYLRVLLVPFLSFYIWLYALYAFV